MKYFIFGLVLFLFGCSTKPGYSVGDCLVHINNISNYKARCEFLCPKETVLKRDIHKIKSVGQGYYLFHSYIFTMSGTNYPMDEFELEIDHVNRYYIKRNCSDGV